MHPGALCKRDAQEDPSRESMGLALRSALTLCQFSLHGALPLDFRGYFCSFPETNGNGFLPPEQSGNRPVPHRADDSYLSR